MNEVHNFVLNASILTGMFEDLNIYTYSRREPSGRVGGLRFLFANSALLKMGRTSSEPRAYLPFEREL